MYICKNCESRFDEPKNGKEYRGEYWGSPAYEDISFCPECGSEDYEEADRCKTCGEWFLSEHGEEECPDCMEELATELHAIKDKHGITWDDMQDWIADLFEW